MPIGVGLTALATAAELAKVPKSDSTVTWNATALASIKAQAQDGLATLADINAEVDSALNTAIPGSPTADSINQRIVAIDDLTQASGSGDLAAIKTNIGTPANIDSGGATIADNLKKIADDNGGASFDATVSSLNKLSTAVVTGVAATLQATANTETTGTLIQRHLRLDLSEQWHVMGDGTRHASRGGVRQRAVTVRAECQPALHRGHESDHQQRLDPGQLRSRAGALRATSTPTTTSRLLGHAQRCGHADEQHHDADHLHLHAAVQPSEDRTRAAMVWARSASASSRLSTTTGDRLNVTCVSSTSRPRAHPRPTLPMPCMPSWQPRSTGGRSGSTRSTVLMAM